MPYSFEIRPEVFDKILGCFLLLTMKPDFYIKLRSLNKFERGLFIQVKIGEIPPSGLGGSYY